VPSTAAPTLDPAAPIFAAIPTSSTRTTITFNTQFDPANFGGTVYCAAFAVGASVTKNDIIIANGASTSYLAGATSASVTVRELAGITPYDTYCVAFTVDAVQSLFSDTEATLQQVSTLCCRLVSYTNAPTYVYGSLTQYPAGTQTSLYVFSYELSTAPDVELVVSPMLIDLQGNVESSSVLQVIPASTTYTNASTDLTGSFVVSGSELHNNTYNFVLALSGSSSDQFDNTTTFVDVINSATQKPTPALDYAIFDDSAASFRIRFTTDTDQAGITEVSWPCSDLFNYVGVEATTCVWLSSLEVKATFLATTTVTLVSVTEPIILLDGLIEAYCAPTDTNCEFNEKAAQQNTPLLPPLDPIIPVVILRIPSTSSSCDDVIVDSTLTYGSGGRDWTVVNWTVTHFVGLGEQDTTDILAQLNSYGKSTVVRQSIPQNLIGGGTYTIGLTVQNFLGEASSSSTSFSLDSNPNLPLTNILGPDTVPILPGSVLTLYTVTTQPTCAEATSSLSYVWTVEADGVVLDIPTQSSSPTKYLLSEYSLTANTVYTITYTVTASATDLNAEISATDTVTVNVGSGDLIPVIAGGTTRQLSTIEPFTLDASGSYDENVAVGNEVLFFQWSCTIQTTTRFNEDCSNLFGTAATNGATVTIDSTLLDVFTQYGFLVTLTSDDSRSASELVLVENTGGDTSTSITTTLTKVNADDKIILEGIVQASYDLDCAWSADVAGVAVSLQANTDLTGSFVQAEVVDGLSFPVVLPGGNFVPGSAVTFRLTAHFGGNSSVFASFSEMTVQMNSPPSGGSDSITPTSGFALDTVFLVVSVEWVDDPTDYPLSFEYKYQLGPSRPALTTQSRSSSNTVETDLPAGLDSRENLIDLITVIYDVLLASVTETNQVTVTVDQELDVNAYASDNIAQGLSDGDSVAVTQTVSNTAAVLSAVNCSAATTAFCANLNRDICLDTPQTCSSCLTGFDGLSGDSNLPCRNLSAIATPLGDIGANCTVDADCLLSNCTDKTCFAPIQICSSVTSDVCSGRGSCEYVDSSNTVLDFVCTILDTDCSPQCACDEGWGGSSCELNADEVASRDNTREQLCEAIVIVANFSDPSSELVDTLVASLLEAYNPDEVVSASAIAACQNALAVITDLANTGLLTNDATVLQIVQLNSEFVVPASDDSTNRRLQSSNSTSTAVTSTGSEVNDAVSTTIQAVIEAMANGENAKFYADDNLQVIIYRARANSLTSTELAPPSTEQQIQFGSGFTSNIEFNPGAAEAVDNGNGYVLLAILYWGQNPFPNATSLGTSLFRIEAFLPPGVNCTRRLERLEERKATRRLQSNSNATTDFADFYVTMQYNSVQDLNFTLTIDEAIAQGAPNFTIPECSIYDGTEYIECNGCNVTSYTNYNVTYGCPISVLLDQIGPCAGSSSSSRKLQTGDDDATQTTSNGQVQFGTLFTNVAAQFNLLTTNPFNIDWDRAKIPVSFLCCLYFLMLVGYWFFHRWDIVDRGYIVYARPEAERKHFAKRHEDLLEKYRETKQPVNWNAKAKPRRVSVSGNLKSAMRPSILALTGIKLDSPRLSSPRLSLVTAKSMRGGTHAQYNKLFEDIDGPASEKTDKDMYVQNVVADFLDSVMPPQSLAKNSEMTWSQFFLMILTEHEYTAMFFGGSLRRPRVMRYTIVVIGLLLVLFFDTLFFGVFYPDDGACEGHSTKRDCLEEPSRVTDANLCRWQINEDYDEGGTCEINPPPDDGVQSIQFLMVVVIVTLVITVPMQFAYDMLLFNVCFRRPKLENWGINTEAMIGRSTQESTLDKEEVQESPIQQLYNDTDARNRQDRIEGVDWDDKTDAEKLVKLQEDHDFVSKQVYENYMPPSFEADFLLKEVHEFFEAYVSSPDIPWQASKMSIIKHAKANAIQDFIGIHPDGTPVPLTFFEWLWYGTPRNKLISRIAYARKQAKHVEQKMTIFGDGELQNRDSTLIQYFILEQFGFFKQFVLKKHMFDYSTSSPLPINAYMWTAAWFFVVCTHLFLMYWNLLWTATRLNATLENWAENLIFSLLEDVFIVHVFRVYLIFVLSMVSIKPQLKYIYRVLNRVAISYAQSELDANFEDVRVVQFMSPACRAARMRITENLATSNILRHIDDVDVEICRIGYRMNVSVVTVLVLSIPLALAILNEALGDVVMESIFPAVITSILFAHYYVWISIGFFIMLPYALLFYAYFHKHKVHKTSAKVLARRQTHENMYKYSSDGEPLQRDAQWHTANRATIRSSSWLRICTFEGACQSCVDCSYYLTRPVKLYRYLTGVQEDAVVLKFNSQWRHMNSPMSLQGAVLSPQQELSVSAVGGIRTSLSGSRDSSPRAARVGAASSTPREMGLAEIRETIPEEILMMRSINETGWFAAWMATHSAELAEEKRLAQQQQDHGYFIDMLNHRLNHVHQPRTVEEKERARNVPPAVLARPEDMEKREIEAYMSALTALHATDRGAIENSTDVVQLFRDTQVFTSDPNVAVDRMVRQLQKRVMHGEMQLIDPEEEDTLFHDDVRMCNVLIEFYDLRVLLTQMLRYYAPGGHKLEEEEQDELMDDSYQWSKSTTEQMLQRHYANAPTKLKALGVAPAAGVSVEDVNLLQEEDEGPRMSDATSALAALQAQHAVQKEEEEAEGRGATAAAVAGIDPVMMSDCCVALDEFRVWLCNRDDSILRYHAAHKYPEIEEEVEEKADEEVTTPAPSSSFFPF